MPRILQHRRDSTSGLANTLGAEGEFFYDITNKTIVVMDGTTTGGTVLAKVADLSAVSSTVASVSSTVASVSSTVASVSSTLASVSSTVSALTVTVSSLSSRVNYSSWTIRQSSNSLYFIANGVNVGRLDTSGNFTVIGNITAFGVVP
jgi:hypothetical protein